MNIIKRVQRFRLRLNHPVYRAWVMEVASCIAPGMLLIIALAAAHVATRGAFIGTGNLQLLLLAIGVVTLVFAALRMEPWFKEASADDYDELDRLAGENKWTARLIALELQDKGFVSRAAFEAIRRNHERILRAVESGAPEAPDKFCGASPAEYAVARVASEEWRQAYAQLKARTASENALQELATFFQARTAKLHELLPQAVPASAGKWASEEYDNAYQALKAATAGDTSVEDKLQSLLG